MDRAGKFNPGISIFLIRLIDLFYCMDNHFSVSDKRNVTGLKSKTLSDGKTPSGPPGRSQRPTAVSVYNSIRIFIKFLRMNR